MYLKNYGKWKPNLNSPDNYDEQEILLEGVIVADKTEKVKL